MLKDLEAGKQDVNVKQLVDDALQRQRDELADTIRGKKPEEKVDPLLVAWLNDTGGTVNLLTEVILDSVKASQEQEKAANAEMRQELAKLDSERPDITKSKAQVETFNELYSATDPRKTVADRIKTATNMYDRILEKAGAGDSKKRIAEAVSLSSASGPKAPKESAVTFDDPSPAKYLEDRQSRAQQLRRGF